MNYYNLRLKQLQLIILSFVIAELQCYHLTANCQQLIRPGRRYFRIVHFDAVIYSYTCIWGCAFRSVNIVDISPIKCDWKYMPFFIRLMQHFYGGE